jgi:tetrahydromethanopterin S-methyltransferase subunit B
MGVCVAEETPQFVAVKSVHIDYDKVYETEMIKNVSKVTLEVVLSNFSKVIEGNMSGLLFQSDLGKFPSISVDGVPKDYASPFTVDHNEDEEVQVTLIANAPEAYKRKENVTLLKITQKIQEKEYSVIEIKRDVSSEMIEDTVNAIFNAGEGVAVANESIANAEEAGVNVDEAKTRFELANEQLTDAKQLYNEGRSEEALEKAELALASAQDAEARAESAVGGKTQRNYGIIVAVVIIAVVAFVLVLQQRKRKRGVY